MSENIKDLLEERLLSTTSIRELTQDELNCVAGGDDDDDDDDDDDGGTEVAGDKCGVQYGRCWDRCTSIG